jgi:hypothetical protein
MMSLCKSAWGEHNFCIAGAALLLGYFGTQCNRLEAHLQVPPALPLPFFLGTKIQTHCDPPPSLPKRFSGTPLASSSAAPLWLDQALSCQY